MRTTQRIERWADWCTEWQRTTDDHEAPGYTAARVAPRLGHLAVGTGQGPLTHGLISVEASRERLTIASPVPTVLDLSRQPARRLSPAEG